MMMKLLFNGIIFLMLPFLLQGQDMKGIAMPSKAEMLDLDAYHVFQTNKYLDFRDMIQIKKYIGNVLYKTTDLRKSYGAMDWNSIENEDASSYKKKNTIEEYTFSGGNMTAAYSYELSQEKIRGAVTTVYNPKGFLLLHKKEETFLISGRTETAAIINEFDNRHRVVKIINRYKNSQDSTKNKETVINASYGNNEIIFSSENGTMRCELVPALAPGIFYSDLSARETASKFIYILRSNNQANAKKYCAGKALDKLSVPIFKKPLRNVSFINGTGSISTGEIKDRWNVEFDDGSKAELEVTFSMENTENGWRINDFIFKEL